MSDRFNTFIRQQVVYLNFMTSFARSLRPNLVKDANPGPGKYNLSIKRYTPSSKIGLALRNLSKAYQNPGPGQYNISTTQSGPKLTISTKHKINSFGSGNPGPGNYNPTAQAIYKNISAYTMGAKYGQSKISDPQPGPGSYAAELAVKQIGVKIGKAKRNQQKRDESPGPGQYTNTRPYSAGPRYRFGNECKSSIILDQQPGPGQYEIGSGNIQRWKGCIIGKKFNKAYTQENPGPGAYQLEVKRPQSGSKIGRASRIQQFRTIGPGPGAYNYGYNGNNGNVVRIGTGQRNSLLNLSTPGPGAYQLYTNITKGITISGYKERVQTELTPGPGQYDMNADLKRPCSAKMGKGKRSNLTPNDTPGPGQYNQVQNVKFKFAYSKQSRSKQLKDGEPGPGHYQIPATVPIAPHYLIDPSFYKLH